MVWPIVSVAVGAIKAYFSIGFWVIANLFPMVTVFALFFGQQRMKTHLDRFNMKLEMRIQLVCALLMLQPYLPLRLYVPNALVWICAIDLLYAFLYCMFACCQPLVEAWLIYRQFVPLPGVKLNFAKLENILDHPKATEAFRIFLQRELNVENLLFYEAVMEYREAAVINYNGSKDIFMTEAQILESCYDIFYSYIGPSSRVPVNISFAVVEEIKNTLLKLNENFEAKKRMSVVEQEAQAQAEKEKERQKETEREKERTDTDKSDESDRDGELTPTPIATTTNLELGSLEASGIRKKASEEGKKKKHVRTKSAGKSWHDFMDDTKVLFDSLQPESGARPNVSPVSSGSIMSREEILRAYPLVTIFDKALREVFRLMQADPLVRFKHSDLFRQLQAEVQVDKDTAKILRELEM